MPSATPGAVCRLGSAYARLALGCAAPRVGLLSVGEEESKGNDLTREAHQLLKAAPIAFAGNVEGREVYAGEVDRDRLRRLYRQRHPEDQRGPRRDRAAPAPRGTVGDVRTRVGYLLSRQAFRRFRKRLDASEYRGAPLVGLNGLCVVGHGRSSAKAVRNAVAMAARFASEGLLEKLSRDSRRGALHPHMILPGQGAQTVRRAQFPICRDTFREADEALGEPLSRLCFESPDSTWVLTENTQPPGGERCGVPARGIARPSAAFGAGHSLGEYSAHVAAGYAILRGCSPDGSPSRACQRRCR